MWCFLLLKKLFLQYLKFRELCYHGRNILCISISFLHSIEKISQFLIFLSISPYLWYFLLQLVFSEPNLHARIFSFIQVYSWNHGPPVTCVNVGNSKFWLRHCKEKPLISLVVSFIMIGWKLLYRPECFIMHGVFYYLKNLFCNTWKFCKLCYHGHNILCISI